MKIIFWSKKFQFFWYLKLIMNSKLLWPRFVVLCGKVLCKNIVHLWWILTVTDLFERPPPLMWHLGGVLDSLGYLSFLINLCNWYFFSLTGTQQGDNLHKKLCNQGLSWVQSKATCDKWFGTSGWQRIFKYSWYRCMRSLGARKCSRELEEFSEWWKERPEIKWHCRSSLWSRSERFGECL